MLYSKPVSDIKQHSKTNCHIINLVVEFIYNMLSCGDEMIREIKIDELNELLELYTHLHELGVPEYHQGILQFDRLEDDIRG